MEQPVKVIELTCGNDATKMLKAMVSSLYVEWLDDLMEVDLPQDVDFDSKEEYEKACKEFMIDLVDQAKEYKEDIFRNVLASYNQFLSSKHDFETYAQKQDAESIEGIEKMTLDMKSVGMVSLFLTFILPQSLPYIILLNGPRIGLDVMSRKRFEKNLEQTRIAREQMKSIQDPMFWFTDQLRTDYHKSNQEFKELRERASNGENIIEKLTEMMSPERLALKRENILKELSFEFPKEQQEETKQYTKKEDNQ